jgi:hypothetical protein
VPDEASVLGPGPAPAPGATGSAVPEERLREATALWTEARRAAAAEDWEAFGRAMARLATVLDDESSQTQDAPP